MLYILVTLEVFHLETSSFGSFLQTLNMPVMSVTLETSHFETSSEERDEQLANISTVVVTLVQDSRLSFDSAGEFGSISEDLFGSLCALLQTERINKCIGIDSRDCLPADDALCCHALND